MNVRLKDIIVIKDKEKEIRGRCPKCFCDDCYFSKILGIFHCFQCGASGRVLDIKTTIKTEPIRDINKIRAFYKKLVNIYHSNLTANALSFLKNRGITDDTINKFKIGFCPSHLYIPEYESSIAEESGIVYNKHVILSGRIVFPYWYRGEVTDLRGRDITGLSESKYLGPYGSYRSRGAVYMFNHDILDCSNKIIITEGEIKALVGIQYGFPIVAWRGVSDYQKNWIHKLISKDEVIVCFDNEVPSNGNYPASFYTIQKLSNVLPHLKVAQLFRQDEQKVDIDSVILNRGISSFKQSIDSAIPAKQYIDLMIRRSIL